MLLEYTANVLYFSRYADFESIHLIVYQYFTFLNLSKRIACGMMRSMLKDSRLKENDEISLKKSWDTFTQLSIKLLNACYTENAEKTEVLITRRLELFNGQSSCLEFAMATKQEAFVAQSAVQGIHWFFFLAGRKSIVTFLEGTIHERF